MKLKKFSPLALVMYNQHDLLDYLLSNNFSQFDYDVNESDEDDRSVLINAVLQQKTYTVTLLLREDNIDVNHKDKEGRTALMHAVSRGYEPIVRLLLTHPQLDLNAQTRDQDGYTALMLAVLGFCNPTVIRVLLADPRTDVNARDKNFWTALMNAAAYSYDPATAVRELLKHPKTDLRLTVKGSHKTALQIALDHRHHDAAALIKKALMK